MTHKTYRTIFVSDVHLGSKDCQAEKLNNFLKHNTCETLYLVGDIIDAWKIQQNRLRWKQSHTNVIRRILGHAKRGTRVVYVAGNHDEFLRPMMPYAASFGSVEICNQIEHIGADGRHYLVVHGDMFDTLMHVSSGKFIMHVGDKLYDILIGLNDMWSAARAKMGLRYWSMSKWIKKNTKQAVSSGKIELLATSNLTLNVLSNVIFATSALITYIN